MTPIKVIKSWHGGTCSAACCQSIHSPFLLVQQTSAAISKPRHATVHWAALRSCLALIFPSRARSPSCDNCPAPLLLSGPLKESWGLKSAKCSTPGALKRPSVQLMVTETATVGRERRPGMEYGKPGCNKGRNDCFFCCCLGPFSSAEGVWNDAAHMAFGWSENWRKRGIDAGAVKAQEEAGCCRDKGSCMRHEIESARRFLCRKTHKPPWNFDYGQSKLLSAPEYSKVKAHIIINHSLAQQQRPHIPTVGKTTPGQAGDTTLATGPGQIYQNLWNSKHESLVSRFSFSAWSPRLTVDIPGFVAGMATQTHLQDLFWERKTLMWTVSLARSVFLICLCTEARFPFLCL